MLAWDTYQYFLDKSRPRSRLPWDPSSIALGGSSSLVRLHPAGKERFLELRQALPGDRVFAGPAAEGARASAWQLAAGKMTTSNFQAPLRVLAPIAFCRSDLNFVLFVFPNEGCSDLPNLSFRSALLVNEKVERDYGPLIRFW